MALAPLTAYLEPATSVVDFARLLGAVCVDNGGELREIRRDPGAQKAMKCLEKHVGAVDRGRWEKAVEQPGNLEALVGQDIVNLVDLVRTRHPLECLGVLRGLCRRTLPDIYCRHEGEIVLDKGTPVPFATRPVNKLFKPKKVTPYQETLNRGHPLHGLHHGIFKHSAGDEIRVVLDFSVRARLDELTWEHEERLPRIATVHPAAGGSIEVGEIGESTFFDVGPADWDEDAILSLLRRAADADVAILPEVSLPRPDALGEALAKRPEAYPPLLVAGSAHHREGSGAKEARYNESRIYLDGKEVAVARKHHPFATREIGGRTFPQPMDEDITARQTTIRVLSGSRTRLAVVICADLNDEDLPSMLGAAGVNLLLVPAFTEDAGGFNGGLCGVASRCQGVGVVANARLAPDGRPFLCMVAVPRPDPADQSTARRGPSRTPPTELGVFDPNSELSGAITWL
jgi:hypothetical protein